MAIREIRLDGDEILTKKAKKVDKIDDETRELVQDMLDTMYKNDGIGLAACQIGVLKSIITYDVEVLEENKKKKSNVLINPKIIYTSKSKFEVEEGCLSFPNIFEKVLRFEKIKVEYTNLDGKKKIKSAEDMEAIVIQHELDHLDGVVFLDRSKELKKQFEKIDKKENEKNKKDINTNKKK
jgi:peptide deformylase